jgi:hypothetical protein
MDVVAIPNIYVFCSMKRVDMSQRPDTMGVSNPPVEPPKVATGFESDDIQDLAEKIARLTGQEAKELEMYLASKIMVEDKQVLKKLSKS